jgi:hypothetical protein
MIECQERYNRTAQNAFHEDSEVYKILRDETSQVSAYNSYIVSGKFTFRFYSCKLSILIDVFIVFLSQFWKMFGTITLKETISIKSEVSHSGHLLQKVSNPFLKGTSEKV